MAGKRIAEGKTPADDHPRPRHRRTRRCLRASPVEHSIQRIYLSPFRSNVPLCLHASVFGGILSFPSLSLLFLSLNDQVGRCSSWRKKQHDFLCGISGRQDADRSVGVRVCRRPTFVCPLASLCKLETARRSSSYVSGSGRRAETSEQQASVASLNVNRMTARHTTRLLKLTRNDMPRGRAVDSHFLRPNYTAWLLVFRRQLKCKSVSLADDVSCRKPSRASVPGSRPRLSCLSPSSDLSSSPATSLLKRKFTWST